MKAIAAVLLIAFGLATLHYVNPDDVAHHREWAREHGAPEPGFWPLALGAFALALGAYLLGSRHRRGRGRALQ